MKSQNELWFLPEQNQTYIELCNTLYERELLRLAQTPADKLPWLPKRLASLPFYVREAASLILKHPSPLTLDSQNACWLHSQSKMCPVPHVDESESIFAFYHKNAKLGLLVPVYCKEQDIEQIRLDSVDEIDHEGQRIHCNEHGWFAMAGWPQEPDNQQKLLLKPSKTVLVAVCCGHQWRNQERKTPRLLSLRELLLASRLNWQNFAKPHQAKKELR
ncbi:MAG TPA: hypothetical protein DF774_04830 [Rheinheimera sp.]|uniref:hypothetical protein n=1 Tax=Rheinheimera sp. TaxID=1869214 RepID=UPI000ED3D0BA|nr:hypothetical protein [Rheinheimera sp.]HCU65069.1 hypothetical protein [Rheinheimera sp.]